MQHVPEIIFYCLAGVNDEMQATAIDINKGEDDKRAMAIRRDIEFHENSASKVMLLVRLRLDRTCSQIRCRSGSSCYPSRKPTYFKH